MSTWKSVSKVNGTSHVLLPQENGSLRIFPVRRLSQFYAFWKLKNVLEAN